LKSKYEVINTSLETFREENKSLRKLNDQTKEELETIKNNSIVIEEQLRNDNSNL